MVADDNRRRLTPDNYLKSQAEMAALFADCPKRSTTPSRSPGAARSIPKKRSPILPRFTGARRGRRRGRGKGRGGGTAPAGARGPGRAARDAAA